MAAEATSAAAAHQGRDTRRAERGNKPESHPLAWHKAAASNDEHAAAIALLRTAVGTAPGKTALPWRTRSGLKQRLRELRYSGSRRARLRGIAKTALGDMFYASVGGSLYRGLGVLLPRSAWSKEQRTAVHRAELQTLAEQLPPSSDPSFTQRVVDYIYEGDETAPPDASGYQRVRQRSLGRHVAGAILRPAAISAALVLGGVHPLQLGSTVVSEHFGVPTYELSQALNVLEQKGYFTTKDMRVLLLKQRRLAEAMPMTSGKRLALHLSLSPEESNAAFLRQITDIGKQQAAVFESVDFDSPSQLGPALAKANDYDLVFVAHHGAQGDFLGPDNEDSLSNHLESIPALPAADGTPLTLIFDTCGLGDLPRQHSSSGEELWVQIAKRLAASGRPVVAAASPNTLINGHIPLSPTGIAAQWLVDGAREALFTIIGATAPVAAIVMHYTATTNAHSPYRGKRVVRVYDTRSGEAPTDFVADQ